MIFSANKSTDCSFFSHSTSLCSFFSTSAAAVKVTLLAFAAERLAAAAVDRYLLSARRSAANPPRLRANDGTDGQTKKRDRWTDDRQLMQGLRNPASHILCERAVSINHFNDFLFINT